MHYELLLLLLPPQEERPRRAAVTEQETQHHRPEAIPLLLLLLLLLLTKMDTAQNANRKHTTITTRDTLQQAPTLFNLNAKISPRFRLCPKLRPRSRTATLTILPSTRNKILSTLSEHFPLRKNSPSCPPTVPLY